MTLCCIHLWKYLLRQWYWHSWHSIKNVLNRASLVGSGKEFACQCRPAWFLAQDDLTYHRATKLVCHNLWACTLESGSHNYWASVLQLLKAAYPRGHAPQQENEDPAQQKINEWIFHQMYWINELKNDLAFGDDSRKKWNPNKVLGK